MASSSIKFDIPATYMRGFDLAQQKGLQRLLAYSFANLPSNLAGSTQVLTGTLTGVAANFSGAVTALTMTGKNVVTTISGDGAITIAEGIVKLTKGSAAAITLAAPTAAQEGTTIRVISNSAFAHVITATGLLDDGVTGGSKNTATFGAFAGASIELVAINLKWSVLAKNVVTVA